MPKNGMNKNNGLVKGITGKSPSDWVKKLDWRFGQGKGETIRGRKKKISEIK